MRQERFVSQSYFPNNSGRAVIRFLPWSKTSNEICAQSARAKIFRAIGARRAVIRFLIIIREGLFIRFSKIPRSRRAEFRFPSPAREGLCDLGSRASFRPRQVVKLSVHGPLVQRFSTLPCHGRGHGFNPHTGRHFSRSNSVWFRVLALEARSRWFKSNLCDHNSNQILARPLRARLPYEVENWLQMGA